jgi:hypothetical protein
MDEREQSLSTRDLAGDSAVEASETDTTERDSRERRERAAAADTSAEDRGLGAGHTAATDVPPAEEPAAMRATAGDVETAGDRPASTDEMTAGRRGEADALLPADENAEFQSRWESLQTGFVDQPRRTVEQADELVAQVMKRLADGFATERERLEQQWGRGEDISTEDLRVTLQRYRAFFQRLLSA